ncbi:hypothetical protein [Campylobacter mucosalis]|uniref:hypothetical protein n=1 Tax=Campylobacter mucosalis TaxID=202 RepID=UPI001470221A|nr:hypothetical protein [Campylobacter mucosalis]
MSKIVTLIAFFATFLFATPPNFASTHTFELKKDEWARVFVVEKATQKMDSFDFRWTLFDTKNINLQTFFRFYPKHVVLGLAHKQDRFVQSIIPAFNQPPQDSVKLYLTFLEFKNKRAFFRVDILDPSSRIDTQFIDPPKRN